MRTREVNRRIERLGRVRAARQIGSHRRYIVAYTREDGTPGTVATTVPQHPGDLRLGTIRAIERDLEPAFGKGWLL